MMKKIKNGIEKLVSGKKGLAVILVLLFLLYSYNLSSGPVDDDEGQHLYASWRISGGETLYRDVMNAQTPVAQYAVGFLFRSFGVSLFNGRILSVVLGVLSAGLVYLLAREAFDAKTALLSAALFGFSEMTFEVSRLFRLEIYFVFFYLASLLLFVRAVRKGLDQKGSEAMLFASGALLGFSLMAKYFAALFLASYALFFACTVALKRMKLKDCVRPAVMLSAGFALVSAAFFAYFWMNGALSDMIYQTITMHSLQGSFLAGKVGVLYFFNKSYPLLAVLGLAGAAEAVSALRRKETSGNAGIALASQLSFAALLFLMPRPMHITHLFGIVPVLCIFASDSIVRLASSKDLVFRAAGILALLSILLSCVPNELSDLSRSSALQKDVSEYVSLNTAPGDYVFSDNAWINFLSQRKVPGKLVDVSESFTANGIIDTKDVVPVLEENKAKMVLLRMNGSHLYKMKHFEDFKKYLDDNYRQTKTFSEPESKSYWTVYERP